MITPEGRRARVYEICDDLTANCDVPEDVLAPIRAVADSWLDPAPSSPDGAPPHCGSKRYHWSEPRARGQVGSGPHPGNRALRLQGGASSYTPPEFRDALLAMARSAHVRSVAA